MIAASSGWLLIISGLHVCVTVWLFVVIVLWWTIVLHLLRVVIVTSDALIVSATPHRCASIESPSSSWLKVVSVIFVGRSAHVSALTKTTPAATLVIVSWMLAILLLFKSCVLVHIRIKPSPPAHFSVPPKLATTSHFAASSHLLSKSHGWGHFELFNLMGMILLL